jgi:hypothetical protein
MNSDDIPPARTKQHWSGMRRRRLPHNLIERRYRDNLNTQIEALRLSIPSLAERCLSSSDGEDGYTMSRLPSKITVISSANSYIKEQNAEILRLLSDTNALREQVSGLERLVCCDDSSVMNYLTLLQPRAAAISVK